LKRLYDCLATSICQQCAERGQDGMQCLLPFLMVNVLNTVFDLFKLGGRNAGRMPYGAFLMGTIVAEGAAAYFSYSVFKVCRDMSPAPGTEMEGGMGGGSGYVQAGDSSSARTIHSFGGGGGGSADASGGAEAQGSSFALFSGSGNRLGG